MKGFRAEIGEPELQTLSVAVSGITWIGAVRRIPEAEWTHTTRMLHFGKNHDHDPRLRDVLRELRPILDARQYELPLHEVPAQRVESIDPHTGDLLILYRIPVRLAKPSGGGTGPGEPMPVLKQAAAAG